MVLSLVGLLLMPLYAAAAPKGSNLLPPRAEALIAEVSVGSEMAFRVRFLNSGSSTLSNLYFDGSVSNGAEYTGSSDSACGGGPDLSSVRCFFPQLKAGDQVDFEIYFVAKAAGQATIAGSFVAEAQRGQPGNRFDSWPINSVSVTADGSPARHRTWVRANSTARLNASGAAQQVQVEVKDQSHQGYAAGIALVSSAGFQCAAPEFARATTFGDAVDMSINSGRSALTATIQIPVSALPAHLQRTYRTRGESALLGAVRFAHVHDDEETCQVHTPGDGSRVTGGAAPTLIVVLALPHNGKLAGF